MTAVIETAAADLAGLADDQLAEMFRTGDAATQAAVLAEMERQDLAAEQERRRRAWRASPAGQRYAEHEAAWTEASHAEYLAADEATRGNLLSRQAPARDAWPMLWCCSDRDFDRWASEDLKRWRQFDAPAFTRKADYMRQASRPRVGDHPWHDEPQEDPPMTVHTVPPAPAAAAEETAEEREDREEEERWAARDARAAERAARVAERRAQAAVMAPGGTVAVRSPQVIVTRHPEIDGAEVLRFARAYLTRFGYWPSPAAITAGTLWPAHAHARDASGTLVWDASPRLYLLSEEPGSGKSTLLELTGLLCPAVFGLDVEPSEAGLAHTIGREHATVLLDEADVLFGAGKRKAAVRAILNAGYARNGTWLRMRGGKGERVAVFGAAAVAGLDVMETGTGDSLTALMQRGIKIRVRRCPDKVSLPRMDRRAAAAAGQISAMLAAWTADRLADLQDAAETVQAPAGVRNRAEQIWRPLLAVAEVAGEEWPDLAAEACADLALAAPSEYGPPATGELDGLRDLVASWAGGAQ